jgi:hypothetical protein
MKPITQSVITIQPSLKFRRTGKSGDVSAVALAKTDPYFIY